ncbi:hypothetical protein [Devosia ginsengisoli]|uniref:hypothetical protein n=1 Tax=Devosia ginsengisoli TaxID=400770 RepID=UPI0026F2A9DF|nr:hypothetical protein [Devosia ginsengisoli]MCR6673222.1 hypothetical protein [Devosia ginsengisoli]
MTATPASTPVWAEKPHTLKFPVPVDGGDPITVVIIYEPDSEALERIEALNMQPGVNPTVAQTRGVVEAMSRLPDGALKKAHFSDIKALGGIAGPFLEAAVQD